MVKERAKRQMLKRVLATAWKRTIDTGYENMQINSERGLQVIFCTEITRVFEQQGTAPRRLFIEPSLRLPLQNGKQVIPDIIICNRNEIIAAVEIKYTPKGKPNYQGDIENLSYLADNCGDKEFSIVNERYLGPQKDKSYSFSKDVVFAWAGIYKAGDANACVDEMESYVEEHYPDFKPTFLSLHAETSAEARPKVFSNPKRLKLIERSEK